ncbi:MAG TPA: hypothetical protein VLJ68_06280, partial [Chitinophagaceae bacterium]|nr:hypothetical protein [Chitinophagaceae bacterium]
MLLQPIVLTMGTHHTAFSLFLQMTIRDASDNLKQHLLHIYSDGEIGAITRLVMEHVTGNSPQAAKPGNNLEPPQLKAFDACVPSAQSVPAAWAISASWASGPVARSA